MKKHSGVSLLEAMVTMGLVSLTLALTAGLMRMYSRGSRLVGVRNTGYQALEAVLYQVRSEAMSAVDFQSPATAGTTFSPTLEFRKVDRHYPGRLQDYPTGWSPYDIVGTAPNDNFLVSIRFEIQNQSLNRDVRMAGESSFASYRLIPQEMISFGARVNSDDTIEIRMETEGAGAGKTRLFENKFLKRIR